MNLGQSLLALLALTLLVTITVSINRARITATTQTVDLQADLEAINYGQSIIEVISNRANTDTGFNNLSATFDNWSDSQTFTAGSGRTLYAHVEVDDTAGTISGVAYKMVTVSIYTEPSYDTLLSRYRATFNKWW